MSPYFTFLVYPFLLICGLVFVFTGRNWLTRTKLFLAAIMVERLIFSNQDQREVTQWIFPPLIGVLAVWGLFDWIMDQRTQKVADKS